ncbi:MAG: FecR family protein [Chitinophagaceae bacterium]|nr:FecR family protein [Chitinophagaceae bacterium]
MRDIDLLWNKFIDKTATNEEIEQLFASIADESHRGDHIDYLDKLRFQVGSLQDYDPKYWEPFINRILKEQDSHKKEKPPVSRMHFIRTAWFRYAAAILIIAGAGVFLVMNNHTEDQDTTLSGIVAPDEILPGGNKAVLTLSDGRKIELKEGAEMLKDGGVSINKNNGELIYNKTNILAYNMMSTPRGGQYRLSLPDGTRVWLNASSSITYPTAFHGKERKVSMTGEAYFEVARNETKPFYVEVNNITVEVLGTHFNINAYPDEQQVTTTLLEGSVKINASFLKPGQAWTNGVIRNADTEQAVAWKNGYFNFNRVGLPAVMRQISRWYDVDVVYEGKIPDLLFLGEIQRELQLSDVLEVLKRTEVHFKIEGKKIVVMP